MPVPLPASLTFFSAESLRRVQAQEVRQAEILTQMHLPLARLAVAPRIEWTPKGCDDPRWNDLPDAGALIAERLADGFDDDTTVTLASDAEHLYVRFASRPAPAHPNFTHAYYRADCVEVFLDPAHDHQRYYQFALTGGGYATAFKSSRPLDSMRWERKQKSEELGQAGWRGDVSADAHGWRALFAIPYAFVGGAPRAGRPWGFNVLRSRRDGRHPVSLWNHTHIGPHAPWAFGELVCGDAPRVHAEEVDLGEVKLWENRGALFVRNLSGAALQGSLRVAVHCREDESERFFEHRQPVALIAHGGPQRVPFAYSLDPEDYKWQTLHLELSDAAGAPLWSASYRFGRGQGLLLQLDDRREAPAPNPLPGDPKFMQKKRRFILCALPRFARKTTAQGAPSDFTLAAEDGSVSFDLMKPGALQRIADWLYARFDNDTDRLLGANFFVHQTAVMTYANVPTSLSTQLSSLSILRFGSGQCCAFAAALVGLVEKMKCEATGKPYRATRVGIPGHITTVVEFGGKWVHLDPSVGRFYYLRDDRTLASMEDILADPTLAARAGKYLEEFHRKGSEAPDNPTFYRPDLGVWPPGAPME